jgi:hypothetical protein
MCMPSGPIFDFGKRTHVCILTYCRLFWGLIFGMWAQIYICCHCGWRISRILTCQFGSNVNCTLFSKFTSEVTSCLLPSSQLPYNYMMSFNLCHYSKPYWIDHWIFICPQQLGTQNLGFGHSFLLSIDILKELGKILKRWKSKSTSILHISRLQQVIWWRNEWTVNH